MGTRFLHYGTYSWLASYDEYKLFSILPLTKKKETIFSTTNVGICRRYTRETLATTEIKPTLSKHCHVQFQYSIDSIHVCINQKYNKFLVAQEAD